MPSKPKQPCKNMGCPNLTTDGYCEAHAKDRHQYDRFRGTAAQRGYDGVWRKARVGFLRKHPLCVHCLNGDRLTEATVVDHIKPHKGDKELFWDRNNWQPLCQKCHGIKTATEDGGFGNANDKDNGEYWRL
ncbi:HNH endonuclease signature motif containing protein [Paenibacillus macquariensis]|uniref:Putative HNH nuclease YajD n=1 Tax=Paenibacillus macquariensis TaxID=948756 RepID=A0ABY1JS25_9BACL|nr:HNH endonuclease signature motif containing protein [Paenibacillus macquariensis]MEC0092871.1 HNH endonuclease signature motif containing protein [Paenibacillus macquariensis]OAB36247.1 HNH endonuclease [Paenibacillus macquariensis subsp. macquariensis]SIQ67886.1 5-methylcytosine-specific restriction enzyme A [Paenibacillus macquariensis]